METLNDGCPARWARARGILRKRWYLVLLCGLVGGYGAFIASVTVTPTYHSSASLFFSLRDGDGGAEINQGLSYTQNQMFSFARLATSDKVLSQVEEDLGDNTAASQVRQSLTVTASKDTVILDIGVDTASPVQSARVANSVAENLRDAVAEVAPTTSEGTPAVVARVIEPATAAKFQSAPETKKNVVLGGVFGLAVSVMVIFLVSAFDTKFRSPLALKAMTSLPLIGVVERMPASSDERTMAVRAPTSGPMDSFRHTFARLRLMMAHHDCTTISVTSAMIGEGKTTMCLNLALTLSESRKRTLLIDAHVRSPGVASRLDITGAEGLSTILKGDTSFVEAVRRYGDSTLDVLSAGEDGRTPAGLFCSTAFTELIAYARHYYDVVMVDTPPITTGVEAVLIARQVDSTILIADSSKLRKAQMDQTTEALIATGAHVTGIILNRVKPAKRWAKPHYPDENEHQRERYRTTKGRSGP